MSVALGASRLEPNTSDLLGWDFSDKRAQLSSYVNLIAANPDLKDDILPFIEELYLGAAVVPVVTDNRTVAPGVSIMVSGGGSVATSHPSGCTWERSGASPTGSWSFQTGMSARSDYWKVSMSPRADAGSVSAQEKPGQGWIVRTYSLPYWSGQSKSARPFGPTPQILPSEDERAFTEPHSVVVPSQWFEELSRATINEDDDFVLPWNEDEQLNNAD